MSAYVLNVSNDLVVGHGHITLEGGTIEGYNINLSQPDGSIIGAGIINAANHITGSGLIEAEGGTLEVQGGVGGQVQLDIAQGADLKLDSVVGANTSVIFQDAQTATVLDLTGEGRGTTGEIRDFKSTVYGFGAGDDILVQGAGGDTLKSNGDGLYTVDNSSGNAVEKIQLDPNGVYAGIHLSFSAGIDTISLCFMPGTMVATPIGEVAVETVKRGDKVLTTDGRAVPVTWLGRQTVSTVFADPRRVLPIRIKAGALADNVPSRDLLLSPDHAILVEGALIQAGALVNGSSIVREINVPQVFTYYHVEVDDHSLILAENTPAETFVDNVDRLNFDNWAEHQALFPEGKSIKELPYPRAKAHRQVPVNIRVKLAERAQLTSAAVDEAAIA